MGIGYDIQAERKYKFESLLNGGEEGKRPFCAIHAANVLQGN